MLVSVRDFLQETPYTSVDVMAPKGIVPIADHVGQWILTKKGQNTKLKANGIGTCIPASEVLDLVIWRIVSHRHKRNHFFLITGTSDSPKFSFYPPSTEFQQLSFDLSDIPPPMLNDNSPSCAKKLNALALLS